MLSEAIKELEKIIKELKLKHSAKTLLKKRFLPDWMKINKYPYLSENFMRTFIDYLNIKILCEYQTLSTDFMFDYRDRLDWYLICLNQQFTEKDIMLFQNYVHWNLISYYQPLTDNIIRMFHDKLCWNCISKSQPLSNAIKKEFKNKIDFDVQEKTFPKKSFKQKLKEAKEYANRYNLKIVDNYLYAYRMHDTYDTGLYFFNRKYEIGKYYRDWHCDMNPKNDYSFGYGIFPRGNVLVQIPIEDWGCWVNESFIARVWGFRPIRKIWRLVCEIS